jgi:hypothetical protein
MTRRKKAIPKPESKVIKPSPVKLSPILRSAFEVLEHGLWHFLRSTTTTDMKLALLHVDQAVELLLKERVRSAGKSIYKNPKETITIWGAYEILEKELNCKIPEKADLELLHEERNSIQHKSSNPSPEDASFHIEKAMRFISRFVKDELRLNLTDHISSEYIDQILPP